MRRPVFLTGKVIMEDGTPPPDSVTIERMCNGLARPEGYTDSKGRFSIELGRNTMMMADASVSGANDPAFSGMGGLNSSRGGFGSTANPMGGLSERDLMGCELRATLPGYRSDVVMLTGRKLLDNPDVGTIILHRLGNVEGTTISATSLHAPKDARKAYDKGREALRKQKWADAQKQLEKAVQVYPEFAAAWYELGRSLESQEQLDKAREAYGKSLAADPKFVNPYLQLAGLAARDKKWQEVADTTDRVVRLNPVDFPGAYFFSSIAHYNLKNLDAAEKSAREGIKADTQHRFPKINHILGVILAQKGEFTAAAGFMKDYLKFAPKASDADVVKNQLAELEKFAAAQQPAQPPAPQQ
jgi:tetratricopeptide (TPR) repeat protein